MSNSSGKRADINLAPDRVLAEIYTALELKDLAAPVRASGQRQQTLAKIRSIPFRTTFVLVLFCFLQYS
ncbi:hypothetical protein AALA54_13450 [Oscillospiraceae bacterium 44-34]